jgi:predicted alpha/beta-fold hydrolase
MEQGGRSEQSRGNSPEVTFDESFNPPVWLRSPHLQSLLVSLPVRRKFVERRAAVLLRSSEEHLLDCGDGVTLQSFHSSPTRVAQRGMAAPPSPGTVVLVHGWEGSSDSLYMLSLAQTLFNVGFDIVRLNLRDHGATHHLNRDIFHSCLLPEVVGAVKRLQEMAPGKPLHLAGVSLGGNFMLRVAAKAREAGLNIGRVVAISPVLDPVETLHALETGLSLYHWYFIRKWNRSLVKKQAAWPDYYNFAEFLRLTSLRDKTAEMVARFTRFASLDDYLNGYSITGDRLATLSSPATIITSLDDPIIPARGLERLIQSPYLKVTLTRHGGHCGFFDTLSGETWLEKRLVAELSGKASTHDAAAELTTDQRLGSHYR